jgi:predicted dehydrogenase
MPDKLLPTEFSYEGPFPRLSRRLRIGIVGGGRIANTQATAARLTNSWEVVAGALSSDPEKAKTRGEKWYLQEERCYSSFEEMARIEAGRADGIDAVMITTPNHLHYDAARVFLEAGIDVLCDKPLTNQFSEAADLARLTHESGCVFGVCFVMASFPMVRQAREMVQAGLIGRVNQIHVEFMQDWMVPDDVAEADHVKWRLDPSKSGATSCTGDIATHAHHLATFVSGLEMTDLRAEMHVCGAPKALEDTVIMMTRFEGEIPGTLIATRLASGNRGGLRVRVYGSEGGIEWDLEKPDYLKYNRHGDPDAILSRGQGSGVTPRVERFVRLARGFSEGVIEAWANLYVEFAMAVAARRDGIQLPPDYLDFPTVADGVKGVRFVDAAVQSNRAGGAWVTISPV